MPWRCQPGSSLCREGSKPSGVTYGLKSSDTKRHQGGSCAPIPTDLHVTFAVHPIASNGWGGHYITKNYPLEGDNFLAKRQPFFGVVPRKKKSLSPRKVPSAQQIPGRKQETYISKLTGRSGSRFRSQTIFAICYSYIESTDGVNKNMSLSKD